MTCRRPRLELFTFLGRFAHATRVAAIAGVERSLTFRPEPLVINCGGKNQGWE